MYTRYIKQIVCSMYDLCSDTTVHNPCPHQNFTTEFYDCTEWYYNSVLHFTLDWFEAKVNL